ncbi:MAG: nitroreductase [Verrucomicrobiales bacterium]|jgi:nitroreductase
MKPNESEPTIWKRLLARFHRKPPTEDSAPFGFATRVVERYREMRKNEAFRAWERLSIRAAAGCAVFAAAFGIYSLIIEQNDLQDQVLIEPPLESAAEVVGLEF